MSLSNHCQAIQILLVEDNEGDIVLAQEALSEGKVMNHLQIARDGIEAMRILLKEDEHAKAPVPDLILLDLNLPRKSGLEVLTELKAHPNLKTIPVVMLTTSRAEEDILRSYRHHANCYITKPIDLDQFISVVKTIEEFWLGIVMLPPRTEESP